MRFISGRSFAAILFASALGLAQQVPDQLIELKADGARVFAASRTQALTGPAASPADAVRVFLSKQGKSARALDSLVQVAEAKGAPGGVTHVRFQQTVEGLDVYGAYVKASVNSRGELVHLIEILPEPAQRLVSSNVSARAALDAALRELYPNRSFDLAELPAQGNSAAFSSRDGFFFRDPTCTRVALPLSTGAMQQGWVVETWTRAGNELYITVVANGARVLAVENRTADDTYNVFTEHPTFTLDGVVRGASQTVATGPGAGNAESRNGWISADGRTGGVQRQFRLSGNNVDAYLDTDANNSPDSSGNVISDANFTAAAVLTDSPATAVNKQVAVQNLFWAANTIHDQLYKYGFNEAAGNMQQNNFGAGGLGNDSLLAEAQDGSGTNNANFSTPNDGSSPRMQMFLWNKTTPNRDGDVDSDIVFHEYGHGLTWRMIGSMSGCMSGSIGEGASDALALLMNQDDVVGEYSYNNSNGIRRWPYTNYPMTYGQLTNEEVHAAGEIYAAALWRARSYLNNDALLWQYFVDGMNYIPTGPKFEHMRDGIVQAAGGLTGDGCLLYKAFADFGVGQGASGACTTRGFIWTTTTWSNTQSFALPAACQSPVTDLAITALSASASVAPGSTSNVVATVKNVGNQPVSSPFLVALAATEGTVSPAVSFSALAVGASADANFSWTAPSVAGSVALMASHDFIDDSSGNDALSRTVSVVQPPALTLTATARNVKGSRYADLAWSPTASGNIDVYKNGQFLLSTPNDGTYREGPQAKGVKTATYKVCVSADVCSNEATVAF